jgi:hypothetical protein
MHLRSKHDSRRAHSSSEDVSPDPFGNDGLSWDQLDRLLALMREEKPDLSVGAMQAFLFIARRARSDSHVLDLPYLHLISERLGVSYSTTARHCAVLKDGVRGSGGLGWIEKVDPGAGIRVKFMRVSEKGRGLLIAAMGSKPDRNVPSQPEADPDPSPS